MAPTSFFTLYESDGTPIGIINPLSYSVAHQVNSPSVLVLTFDLRTAIAAQVDIESIVRMVRSDPEAGMNAYEEFVGAVRKTRRSYGVNPMMEVVVVDAMRILQDRIVAWYPNLRGVSCFMPSFYPTASSIIRNLWNYNVGSAANGAPPFLTADLGRRYASNLSRWTDGRLTGAVSATDENLGTGFALACSGENVLITMQKVADVASIDFAVRFDIAAMSYTLFYALTLGADRTAVVKMTQDNNTIGMFEYTTDATTAPTWVIATGKGKDKAMLRGSYPSPAPTGTGLREVLIKGGDAETVAHLTALATRRWRQEQRKQKAYNIEVLQSATWQYGRDYFLGDLVTVSPDSINSFTRKVFGVTLAGDSSGVQEVQIDLANP
jgi:hypothetical protein